MSENISTPRACHSSTVYGLVATGITWLDENQRDYSCKRIFRDRQSAEREIPKFIDRVCSPTDEDLDCFRRETVQVDVFEYELVL